MLDKTVFARPQQTIRILCFKSIWICKFKMSSPKIPITLCILIETLDFPLLVRHQHLGKLLSVHFLPSELAAISDLDQMVSRAWYTKRTHFRGGFCGLLVQQPDEGHAFPIMPPQTLAFQPSLQQILLIGVLHLPRCSSRQDLTWLRVGLLS